jgi:hypothetical protein
MGGQVDLPIDKEEELQQASMKIRSQPVEQLEEVIE